jgi:hypothetical protein
LDNYDWTFPWTTQMRMRPDPELCADSIALGPHIEQSVHVPGGLSMLRGGRYKQQQRIDYTAEGLVLSNEQSRETHLLQAQAVEARCSEQCYILFDDTWPMNPASGRYDGKGGGAVDWLLSRGFELVEQSDPDRASHLGFVLVRRLPREQRQICDVSQEERGVGDKGAGGLVQVSFLAPAQGVGQPHLASRRLTSMRQHPASGPSPLSDLSIWIATQESVKAGVLLLEVAVRGLDEGTHSLVFFLEGVELLRATRFDDAPTECVAHTLLTGKEAHSSKTGAALATSSDCAAGEETVRRVGVRIRVAPGEASFGVHVQDARTRRAEAQAECRVTVDPPP